MDYYNQIAKGYGELHSDEQKKKLDLLKRFLFPKREDLLLDVGCGTGISSDWNCEVMGIDPSEELLKLNPFPHQIAHAENIPFKADTFDYVVSLTSLQNFYDLPKALSEIRRVGKPDARFGLSFLKKSPKREKIEKAINDAFSDRKIKVIEEEKDIIFVIL